MMNKQEEPDFIIDIPEGLSGEELDLYLNQLTEYDI
jgi:hypothetical protein